MTKGAHRVAYCKRGHDMSEHRVYSSTGSRCGRCVAENIAARRVKPEKREKILARERAARKLRKYGLTDQCVADLVAAQGGGCAICGGVEWGPRGPNIDHCHGLGHVRGILCMTCNVGIGHFKDDPELLVSAASYLLFRANRKNNS